MPLTIDDSRLEPLNGPLVVRLRDILDELPQNGRYVQEITINGEEITVQSVTRTDFQCQEEDDVRVITCSLDELINNAMESSYEVTPRLHATVKKALEELRSGHQEIGIETLATTIDILEWHLEILESVTQLRPGPSAVHELSDELQQIIPRMHQAWASGDYVLLADVLEYELSQWLERWYATVELFRSQMKLENMKQNHIQ